MLAIVVSIRRHSSASTVSNILGQIKLRPYSSNGISYDQSWVQTEKPARAASCRCFGLHNIMSPELLLASADGLGVRACIAEQSLRRHGSGVSVETPRMRWVSKVQTVVLIDMPTECYLWWTDAPRLITDATVSSPKLQYAQDRPDLRLNLANWTT